MKDMVYIATIVGNVYRGPGRLHIPVFQAGIRTIRREEVFVAR